MRLVTVCCLLTAATAQAQTALPSAGRLLASNCFQCHGTEGRGGFESLAGKSTGKIVAELKKMQQKSVPDIMEAHARGYSDRQLQLIGEYFASLRSTNTVDKGEKHDD